MRVFIAGIEGYIGFALCNHLLARGDTVGGLDAGHRDRWVREVGSQSAIPVYPWQERAVALREAHGETAAFYPADTRNSDELVHVLQSFQPDAIVHLAEQPSAPFSFIHRALTYDCNVTGSVNLLSAMETACPGAHLLKLGTMGEYGTPGVPIPEGVIPCGELAGMMFPRQPGSWYHATKVADSINVDLCCRMWKLRSTDVMQGVVYGTRIDAMGDDPRLRTRFDFDGVFGTAINRFCAQAVAGEPITPYGQGHQKRGFLPLRDSMQCLTLLLDHPPEAGQYRVVNQLEDIYDLTDLAERVQGRVPGSVIRHIGNPRIEAEDHTYEVATDTLLGLGYQPTSDMDSELDIILNDLGAHVERITACADAIPPTVRWAK